MAATVASRRSIPSAAKARLHNCPLSQRRTAAPPKSWSKNRGFSDL